MSETPSLAYYGRTVQKFVSSRPGRLRKIDPLYYRRDLMDDIPALAPGVLGRKKRKKVYVEKGLPPPTPPRAGKKTWHATIPCVLGNQQHTVTAYSKSEARVALARQLKIKKLPPGTKIMEVAVAAP